MKDTFQKNWSKVKADDVSRSVDQVDKYLGTALHWFNSIILLIWLISQAVGFSNVLVEKFPELCSYLKSFSQIAGIVQAALLGFYLLFVVGAFVSGKKARGCRMLFISVITIAGTHLFWRKCMVSTGAIVKIVEICILLLSFYIIQIYGNMKRMNEVYDENDMDHISLIKCKSDKVYVPILLNTIDNQALKERIANEIYTYVYGAYKYKKIHYILLILSILFPAAVTAISGSTLLNETLSSKMIPLLSMLAVIVSSIFNSFKAKESWSRYREYAEKAKKEIFSFAMKIGDYENRCQEEREKILADNMETLFQEERTQWKELRGQK